MLGNPSKAKESLASLRHPPRNYLLATTRTISTLSIFSVLMSAAGTSFRSIFAVKHIALLWLTYILYDLFFITYTTPYQDGQWPKKTRIR